MSILNREDRYIVIKRSDLAKVVDHYPVHRFMESLIKVGSHLPKREFLVIESDWPEYEVVWKMIEQRMTGAAPVVERQPTGQWRIPVNGDWFYGTKEQCERERAEYETTFTAEDYAEAGVVLPEQIWSSPPAPVAVVLPDRREPTPENPYLTDADHEWNACLDKVKELSR